MSPDAAVLNSRATGTTANDYLNGGCKDVIFFFARGTGQSAIPSIIIRKANIAIAGRSTRFPDGRRANINSKDQQGRDPRRFVQRIASQQHLAGGSQGLHHLARGGGAQSCPEAKLVGSGYSQGAALVHAAVEQLTSSARARVFAAVTYGDTQRLQDGGRIPNFDAG